MMHPTEEQIHDCKMKAGAARGDAHVECVEVDEADLCVVARPPTAAEWRTYLDAVTTSDGAADARWNILVRCVLFPALPAITATRKECPGVVRTIVEAIEAMAGAASDPTERPRIVPLTAELGADDLAELGLPADAARELLAKYQSPGQLRIFAHPLAGTIVVKRPTVSVYEQFGRDSSKSQAGPMLDLALSCVVYPALDDFKARVERYPGVPHAMCSMLCDMGGAHTKARRKKV